jgi:hypothetical protein
MRARMSVRLQQGTLIVALATSFLACGNNQDAPHGRAAREAQHFTPLAKRVFAAAAAADSAGLNGLVMDSIAFRRILAVAAADRKLITDAAKDVKILDNPLLVTPDTAWVTYIPRGHHSPRDVLGVKFARVGTEWRVVYVAFLQRD